MKPTQYIENILNDHHTWRTGCGFRGFGPESLKGQIGGPEYNKNTGGLDMMVVVKPVTLLGVQTTRLLLETSLTAAIHI